MSSSLNRKHEPRADDGESLVALVSRLQEAAARQDGGTFPDEMLQDIFGASIKLYSQKFETGHRIPPVVIDDDLNATTMLLTVAMLLKAANLELFELGMWQTFSGVR
jgi:hypothetical protein